MFVISMRGKTIKYAGVIAAMLAILITAVLSMPENSKISSAYVSSISGSPISFKNIKTPEDRISFINSFGIEVDPQPIEELTTKIPKSFDSVYEEYNNLQKSQGLDLAKYKGKKVTRYTYSMLNYPKGADNMPQKVYVNIIMYKNSVIAGDISSPDGEGFVRSFCDFKI